MDGKKVNESKTKTKIIFYFLITNAIYSIEFI